MPSPSVRCFRSLDILRDHFQRRPLQHLIDKFIECDLDNSGDIDEYEFHHAIKSLNLDLSRKDTKALFQLADADGSGAIDADELQQGLLPWLLLWAAASLLNDINEALRSRAM